MNQSPKQYYVNAHMPLYLWNGGIGASLYSDQIGALQIKSLLFSYNRIQKTSFGVVSGSVALGFSHNSVIGSELITPQGIYTGGVINHEDPILSADTQSQISPDYKLSLFIGHELFDLGISLSNLFLPQTDIVEKGVDNSKNVTLFGNIPRYIKDLKIMTSILLKSDFINYQAEISTIVKHGNIFGGLGLRGFNKNSVDALIFLTGIELNKHYKVYYSFDYGLSRLGQNTKGSHEIHVNYNLNRLIGIGLAPEIIYNPRNL